MLYARIQVIGLAKEKKLLWTRVELEWVQRKVGHTKIGIDSWRATSIDS